MLCCRMEKWLAMGLISLYWNIVISTVIYGINRWGDQLKKGRKQFSKELLDYQTEPVKIEKQPVPTRIRWVLYIILFCLVFTFIWACIFKIDRIIVSEGKLVTTAATIVVQPLSTATVKSIDVHVGDVVVKGQVLAHLDSTFTKADFSQLSRTNLLLKSQIRRIKAELERGLFSAKAEEKEDGVLQEQLFRQRKMIFERNKQLNNEKTAALKSKLQLNKLQSAGKKRQLKILIDIEGTISRLQRNEVNYKLQVLESQKNQLLLKNEISSLEVELEVIRNELRQVNTEWNKYLEDRDGELMEQVIHLLAELNKNQEELNKASRLQELISLTAPEDGVVLDIVKKSVGSIVQQAEPFFTLVPIDSDLEAEVQIQAKDIARVRVEDLTRLKLDAYPFQKHGTLTGRVSIISEDAFQGSAERSQGYDAGAKTGSYYRTRINITDTNLKKVPEKFRLIPGMKVRAEIKVGQRSIISYFLYPIIRVLDESLREP